MCRISDESSISFVIWRRASASVVVTSLALLSSAVSSLLREAIVRDTCSRPDQRGAHVARRVLERVRQDVEGLGELFDVDLAGPLAEPDERFGDRRRRGRVDRRGSCCCQGAPVPVGFSAT